MPTLKRTDVIDRLQRLREELSLLASEVERLARDLGPTGTCRPYDVVPDTPEAIAERYGVNLDPDADAVVPEWVRERTAAILGERL